MEFKNSEVEVSEISKPKESAEQFFSQKALDRFDQFMGDDRIGEKNLIFQQENRMQEGAEISVQENKTETFFSEKALDSFDRLMEDDQIEKMHEGLTEEQKKTIREETGWSDEIIDAIGSMEEYEIYKNAGLTEAEINGKKCLIRNDIDWNQRDAMGRTNRERAEQGLSPVNKDGKVIELHHIGQHADSPLAELTTEEHRGKGNDVVLHDKTKESEIDRQVFSTERSDYWETRAKESDNG